MSQTLMTVVARIPAYFGFGAPWRRTERAGRTYRQVIAERSTTGFLITDFVGIGRGRYVFGSVMVDVS